MTSAVITGATGPFASVPTASANAPNTNARSRRTASPDGSNARYHHSTAAAIAKSSSASMIASRPTIACIRLVDSTIAAIIPARSPAMRAVA